jgi:hypothetical protein
MNGALKRDVDAVIAADDPEELLGAIIDIAMASDDAAWATDRLLGLAAHVHTDVRGNALMALTHVVDRFERADRPRIIAALRAGLEDRERHVREQASAALDELGLGDD